MKSALEHNLGTLAGDLRSPTLVSFLDLARWFAASLVFVAHLRNPLFLGYGQVPATDRTLGVQVWYFLTGWHAEAVTVFFVLSGLLVGGAGLARVQAGKFDPTGYALDRLTRLYLPFLPALLLGYAMDVVGSSLLHQVGFWDHSHPMIAQKVTAPPFASGLSPETLFGNILMVQHYLVAPAGSNQPLWTISGEFWFYAVFLLAVSAATLARTAGARLFAALLLVVAVGLLGAKFLVLLGLWCTGVAVALVPARRAGPPAIAAATLLLVLVAARLAQAQLDAFPLLREAKNYLVAISFAWLLVALRGRTYGWLERAAGLNAFLASFSFSLYLLHFPLMLFILALLHATGALPGIASGFNPTDPVGIAVYLLTIVLVYLFSWLFSLATERNTDAVRRLLKKRISVLAARPSAHY
ncbi:acyltransferase family protein [Ramlibacter montanisoli]|uniref:Acyltransferase n=1 Tax=Ramlibacter montanisoli TaxID=2732512 RepID=A0A849KFF8_9BURK|nr:acyltransferase [Ramlibacter montanisoli]NNU43675.1 acyltransferase [Ramlibacter montanisoli]